MCRFRTGISGFTSKVLCLFYFLPFSTETVFLIAWAAGTFRRFRLINEYRTSIYVVKKYLGIVLKHRCLFSTNERFSLSMEYSELRESFVSIFLKSRTVLVSPWIILLCKKLLKICKSLRKLKNKFVQEQKINISWKLESSSFQNYELFLIICT